MHPRTLALGNNTTHSTRLALSLCSSRHVDRCARPLQPRPTILRSRGSPEQQFRLESRLRGSDPLGTRDGHLACPQRWPTIRCCSCRSSTTEARDGEVVIARRVDGQVGCFPRKRAAVFVVGELAALASLSVPPSGATESPLARRVRSSKRGGKRIRSRRRSGLADSPIRAKWDPSSSASARRGRLGAVAGDPRLAFATQSDRGNCVRIAIS